MNRKLILAAGLVICLCCSLVLKEKQNVNVVFIGDSITYGSTPKAVSPPLFAGEYLRKQTDIGSVQIANMGLSGFTTVNFLPGHKTFANVKAAANGLNSDKKTLLIFSIMLGTNDSAIKGPAGAPLLPENYRVNMKLIVDSLTASYPECKVIINHPIWYSDSTRNFNAGYMKEGQLRVVAYKKEIDTLINNYKKERSKQVFMGDKEAYDYFKENYLTDFKHQVGPISTYYLHPNQKGDEALGVFWARAILKIIN